ncbi:MAG: hypothetical protein ACYTHN_13800 [Planctomycetota bacterium]|jgi:hypothetical protein
MERWKKKFDRARLQVEFVREPPVRFLATGAFYADVTGRGREERFRIHVGASRFQVLHVDRKRRHVLAHVEMHTGGEAGGKRKILFGRDERHLFVAEVPRPNVSTVANALEALRPAFVSPDAKRQGEWFFMPAPDFAPPASRIRRKAPLVLLQRRGAGARANDHVADELIVEDVRNDFRRITVRVLLVRGRIRHRDHATVHLHRWHRAVLNQEVRENTVHQFVD